MAILSQMIRLGQVLVQPGGLRSYIRWRPFSITSFTMLRAMKQQGLDFRTVIDGGANVGQFSRAVTEIYPHAKIIAFEALPDVAETLRRNLSDRPLVRVIHSALGRSDGALEFFPNQYSLASSALPLHPNQRSSFPNVHQLDPIRVPMVCLDTVLADELLTPPVLLKLDLQGYELEALKGASQTLARTTHVLLETAFKPIYEGEPLFEELSDFMRTASFRFERPIDFLADVRGEIVQMDALFTRTEAGQQRSVSPNP
jgi:FkbM family methyltransferase